MNLYTNIAEYYDLEDDEFRSDDIEFYLSYAGNIENNVLELGCGTGRVSIEFAKRGYHVTSIDLSDEMLKQFETKIAKEYFLAEKISIIQGNMCDFQLNKKYNLIMAPGRAFQAIYNIEEAKNTLRCIHGHLKPNGLMILDLFNPDSFLNEEYCFEPAIVYRKKVGDSQISMKYRCLHIDRKEQLIYSRYTIICESEDGRKELFDDNILRYYYLEEINEILKSCGFNIIDTYGWFDRSAAKNNREIIVVASLQ